MSIYEGMSWNQKSDFGVLVGDLDRTVIIYKKEYT